MSSLAKTPGAARWKNAKRNRKADTPHMSHARGVGRAWPVTRKGSLRGPRARGGGQRVARRQSGPPPLAGSALPSGPAGAVLTDLVGVDVTVVRVDAEPLRRRVGAALRVRARPSPVGLGHGVEELGRGGPGRLERLERRLPRAVLVSEEPRVLGLVVALDDGVVLDQEAPEPDAGDRLAVRQVMHDLSRAPLAGRRTPVTLVGRDARQRAHHLVVARLVLRDQRLPFRCCHERLLDRWGRIATVVSHSRGAVNRATARAAMGLSAPRPHRRDRASGGPAESRPRDSRAAGGSRAGAAGPDQGRAAGAWRAGARRP